MEEQKKKKGLLFKIRIYEHEFVVSTPNTGHVRTRGNVCMAFT